MNVRYEIEYPLDDGGWFNSGAWFATADEAFKVTDEMSRACNVIKITEHREVISRNEDQ